MKGGQDHCIHQSTTNTIQPILHLWLRRYLRKNSAIISVDPFSVIAFLFATCTPAMLLKLWGQAESNSRSDWLSAWTTSLAVTLAESGEPLKVTFYDAVHLSRRLASDRSEDSRNSCLSICHSVPIFWNATSIILEKCDGAGWVVRCCGYDHGSRKVVWHVSLYCP